MIQFHNLSFKYHSHQRWVIRQANFAIPSGSFCLICGSSGSGKSTLLRLMNGLVPHFSGGILEGEIEVEGLNPVQAGPGKMSQKVGFVFQDPETQFLLDCVEDEIAFNLENAAMPAAQIAQRITDTLQALGIAHLRRRKLESLSGGEKQKVAIATVLSLAPTILILDEPTSQLDGQSAEEVLSLIQNLARQRRLTIVMAEHRLDRLLHFTDWLVYLPGHGEPLLAGEPRRILNQMDTVPPMVQLGKWLGYQPLPLSVSEGRQMLCNLGLDKVYNNNRSAQSPLVNADVPMPVLSLENVSVRFGNTQAVSQVNLQLYASQIACLMGVNGAGKTSLLRAILGLVALSEGCIRLLSEDLRGVPTWKRSRLIGYLPQDPNALLYSETVLEELLLTLRNHGYPEDIDKALGLLERLGVSAHAERYPRDLSVGERQRVALGAILITQPLVLLLDEPTRGLDEKAKTNLAQLLRSFAKQGMSILVVTHDVEFMLTLADRLLIMEKGRIIQDGSPLAALRQSNLPPAQLLQLFPDQEFRTLDEVWQTMGEALSRMPDRSDRPASLACHSDGNRLLLQE
ncbi:MAG: ABC transporter [Anaerolineae bacterium]|nr:MAG: ABC transporter [Anaerolineae bacterium]